MQPTELWWWVEGIQPTPEYAGGMTPSEVEEIFNEAYGDGDR